MVRAERDKWGGKGVGTAEEGGSGIEGTPWILSLSAVSYSCSLHGLTLVQKKPTISQKAYT